MIATKKQRFFTEGFSTMFRVRLTALYLTAQVFLAVFLPVLMLTAFVGGLPPLCLYRAFRRTVADVLDEAQALQHDAYPVHDTLHHVA